MPQGPQQIVDLLFSLFALFVELGCLVFFIILFCLSWRYVRMTWRRGLLAGAITFILGIPSIITGAYFIDVHHFAPQVDAQAVPVVKLFVGVMGLGFMLLLIPLRGIYYHVAACEWGRIRNAPAPTLAGPRGSVPISTAWGIGVGLITLVLTIITFHFGHVRERQDGESLLDMFPGIMDMPPLLLGIVIATFASLYAVVEELIFRGGILGFLLRITGNKTGLAWLFITCVSLLWAVLHYPNTDSPVIKIGQIFFMGLALGGMTRRWGISPAICAHVTLNAGAVILALRFPEWN